MKNVRIISLVLCLILVCSFVFTACDNKPTETATVTPTSTETETETEVVDPNAKPKAIDITVLYYYGSPTENADKKLAFEEYVSTEYGIDFNFHSPARDTYIETINLQAVSGDLTGLVGLFDSISMMAWAQDGIILALDEYLKDNEAWINAVPEDWKELYTWNGEIWGVPKGADGEPRYFVRTMRGDWLNNLELEKPDDINSFYEVVKAFTYDDPDKNGKDDTYGFCSRNTWLMQDIFQAHDARLNSEADVLPIWNPNADIWEDSVVKPEMAEACTFLRKCFVEGLVEPQLYSMSSNDVRNLMANGIAGSCFYWDTWVESWEIAVKKITPTAFMIGIGALKGTITTKLNQWEKNIGAPYVLMANTEQPKEVINWFVTLVWGSPETFFTFKYGIPQTSKEGDQGWFLEGKTVYLLYYQLDPATKAVTGRGQPSITDGHPGYALDVGTEGFRGAYNSGDTDWDLDQSYKSAKSLSRRWAMLEEYNDGRIYILPESMKAPDNENYLMVANEWRSAGLKYTSDVMVEGVAPAQALKDYLSVVMAFNPQETLDYMNAKMGKTSQQNYADIYSKAMAAN